LRYRLASRFSVAGDLRFISHHDTLRLCHRALARADIPVRYSEGFNPLPRVRISLPRPVGVASLDEQLLIELTSETPPDAVVSGLGAQMPTGITLRAARLLADDDSQQPQGVQYALPIDPSLHGPIAEQASQFLARDEVIVARLHTKSGPPKMVNIRPYITTIDVTSQRTTWWQVVSQAGTARVTEVLEAVGLSARDHLHHLCRTQVSYARRLAASASDAGAARTCNSHPSEGQRGTVIEALEESAREAENHP